MIDERSGNDDKFLDELFPLLYEELHQMAEKHMRSERANHTLQTTALVHEAWLRLVSGMPDDTTIRLSREHFMARASVIMRHILINYAKSHSAEKRGGGRGNVQLEEVAKDFAENSIDLLALDEALERLKELDELQSRLVEMRFFGGMNMEQCASVLGISQRTAFQEWAHARAWLRLQLFGDSS